MERFTVSMADPTRGDRTTEVVALLTAHEVLCEYNRLTVLLSYLQRPFQLPVMKLPSISMDNGVGSCNHIFEVTGSLYP